LKAEVDGFIAGAEATIKGWWNESITVTTAMELADAIAEIPIGGIGIITVPGGTELILDKDINIQGKTVLITGNSNSFAKITFGAYQYNDTCYAYHRFKIASLGANLRFHYIDFDLEEPLTDLSPATLGLVSASYAQNSSIVFGACNIELDGTQFLIEASAYGSILNIGIYSSSVVTNGSYFIYNSYRPCTLIRNAVTIDDNTKWVSDENYLIN
jgi:hypothetical protein